MNGTENRRSHITVCWNALEIIRILNASWKPAGHQIRVHMASIGHPLLGDAVYGPKKCPVKNLQGQTLHAMVLGFIHPRTGAYMEFEAPLPEYFSNLLLQFRKNV